MKFATVLLLTALASLTTGCVGYTKFRATNPRGELIAEWTGRGLFYPITNGYQITAVERISGPPLMHVTRYPYGLRTKITGAHIERWHVPKPEWLDELRHARDPAAKYPPRPAQVVYVWE